jgi:thioredoxin-like negative regulator of GroEL
MLMMQLSAIVIFILSATSVVAMYGPKSDVIDANDKNFKDIVLKAGGIVIVEFYAPWLENPLNSS